MILRPYQTRAVENALVQLDDRGNTIIIAATGAGKTIILSALVGRLGGKTLILQHREELVRQNMNKFRTVNERADVSLYTADVKSMRGDTVFAMQQTLCRNLGKIGHFDNCVVDETHHIVAPTYRKIIEKVLEVNPKCKLAGFTATPERGDRKSLRLFFDNVADKISIRELVALGFLVKPVGRVIDLGFQSELAAIKAPSNFGDQSEVEAILNKVAINEEVVRNWEKHAGGRQTIIFTSTVKHAEDVGKAFDKAGHKFAVIWGDMPKELRASILKRFDKGEYQGLVNVAVLTEGYDSQPVSCIVLLRQCSEKGAMIQMAGRGLRTVDPEIHPGVVKLDCLVMDFGTSLMTHGDLDQEDGLHKERDVEGEAVQKKCPEEFKPGLKYRFPDRNGVSGCGAEVPAGTKTCPLCGFIFERIDQTEAPEVVEMIEFEILESSPFKYVDLFGNEQCLMAAGFSAWAGVFTADNGATWTAMGKLSPKRDEETGAWKPLDVKVKPLVVGTRAQAISRADDFMRVYETERASKKNNPWLTDAATAKQMAVLARWGYAQPAGHSILANPNSLTKYAAMCHTNFRFGQKEIEKLLGVS